jgi:hypothetical protein
MRCAVNPRGVSSIRVSLWALGGASSKTWILRHATFSFRASTRRAFAKVKAWRRGRIVKKTLIALSAMLCSAVVAVASTITGVTAQQRYPWNGKVDILHGLWRHRGRSAAKRVVCLA